MLEFVFVSQLQIDIEQIESELNIDWNDVQHYSMEFMQLNVFMKDGRTFTMECEGMYVDHDYSKEYHTNEYIEYNGTLINRTNFKGDDNE